MPGQFCVYAISSTIDGRLYFGRTAHPKERWQCHKGFARNGIGNSPLHAFMRTHGVRFFQFKIISTHCSIEAAAAEERRLVKEHGAQNPARGFNRTRGGFDMDDVIAAAIAAATDRIVANPAAERERLSVAAKKGAASVSSDERRARMLRSHATMGPEKMRENGRKTTSQRTQAQWQDIASKANETLGAAGRSARARKAMKTLGPEGLSARAKKTVAAQTPEQRSEARRRSWVTRRASPPSPG